MNRKIRVVLFSTLFPSVARPNNGLFVEARLRELLTSGAVDARVIAPVPWFMSTHPRFGEYAKFASTPGSEIRDGVRVVHPRYLLPPKIGMNIAPLLLAAGALASLLRLRREGFDFDLIDAHYYYPDGVAAALLGRMLSRPVVVTARGSDVTLIPRHALPRCWILWAARAAGATICVARALADELAALGADPSKLNVLRNGVDLRRFRPIDRQAARAALGWPDQHTLLSVGNLVENKGHHLVIEALGKMPGSRLVIVGAGPERDRLAQLARTSGVGDRVTFAGLIPQSELFCYFSAADILVLASAREGWANVLLEAMACGTPVVATRIWGTPEVVRARVAGRLAAERSAGAIATAIDDLMADYPARDDVRAYAEQFTWEATTRGQVELFHKVIGASS